MHRRQKITGLYLIFVLSGAFLPISASIASGGTVFPVLMELMEPRLLALGGAAVSDTCMAGGSIINPACAAGSHRSVSTAFARHMMDLWSGSISVNFPIQNADISWIQDLSVGGYLNTFDYGEFDETIAGEGNTGRHFSAAEHVLALYMSGRSGRYLGWGLAAKYVWGSIDDAKAAGRALDLGVTVNPHWERLRFGVALRNFGTQTDSYGAESYPMPTELVIGGSKRLLHLPLDLHGAVIFGRRGEGEWDFEFLNGKPGVSFAGGGEFTVQPEGVRKPFFLRIGYRSRGKDLRVGHRLDTLAGFSFGLGFEFRILGINYAYAPMGALGDVHRFGISGSI